MRREARAATTSTSAVSTSRPATEAARWTFVLARRWGAIQKFLRSARNASRVIPAVRIRAAITSTPT
jgi:hypothetical protein